MCLDQTIYVQIPPACVPNTYNVWRDLASSVSISNGNIKCPIGKSILAVNLSLKLFHATIADADFGSLKCLHTFRKKCLYHMQVTFEQMEDISIAEVIG